MDLFLASAFELLFKYRPLLFSKGEIALAPPGPVLLAIILVTAALLVATFAYARLRTLQSRRDRVILAAVRTAAIALLLLCLLRPTLLISTSLPQQTFIGVLIDNSRSMRIADWDGDPRGAFVAQKLGPAGSPLRAALEERFSLRFFQFAGSAQRVDDVATLGYDGSRTDLATALRRAHDELTGVPLAGLVLVSDGADTEATELSDVLLGLRAAGVPVFTVGVGLDRVDRDIEVRRVETPPAVLRGASLAVDLVISHPGFGGTTVPVHVEDEGELVAVEEVQLPAGAGPTPVRVRFAATEPGPRRFRFRVPAQPGELVTQNNLQEALITVHDRRAKILYVEGEPRWEVGFLRRAAAKDANLQLVTLQRTAENRFLRLEVDDADELAAGFPRTREELFAYSGIVLGSIEASFFSHEQLQMIADFVSHRGGGLLALGGRRAFSEGGYAGTPLEPALPVVLDENGQRAAPYFAEIRVRPTRAGELHPVLMLAGTERESAERWNTLPPLSTVNRLRRLQPGATALLAGTGPDREQIVLAHQRFGRGHSLAFGVQDSWIWQMHADIAVDDETHQTFWRQLLRWQVHGVPAPVRISLPRDRIEPGDALLIRAHVDDERFLGVNNARVTARITAPNGELVEIPLDWSVETDGEYRAGFTATEPGLYAVELEARIEGVAREAEPAYFLAEESNAEYFDASMRSSLLRRIARETGGQFYTPANVINLPDDIQYTGAASTLVEEKDLWDMPIIFLLLVGLMAGEWVYRRRRGLA